MLEGFWIGEIKIDKSIGVDANKVRMRSTRLIRQARQNFVPIHDLFFK